MKQPYWWWKMWSVLLYEKVKAKAYRPYLDDKIQSVLSQDIFIF